MSDCNEERIDQSLPFGTELTHIFTATSPLNSLQSIITAGLLIGTHIEFLHNTLGDTPPKVSLQYVLKSGAAPAGPLGYYVQPDDYNAVLNNVHWALAKVESDGAVCIYNANTNGGTDGGGWNIPAATGDAVPILNLSDDDNRIVKHEDFT